MASDNISALTGLKISSPTKGDPKNPTTPEVSTLTGLKIAPGKLPNTGFDAFELKSQAIDLTNVYPDPIEKYAEYNVPLNPFVDWNETRAQNQGTGEKWANGLTKAVITAGGAFTENTIGFVAGIGNMMFGNGSFYDNPVGRGIDSVNEWAQRELPNYYTQAEQYGSILENLGTANFWADKVANGVGYTLGSIATMFVGTGEAALVAKLGNLGKTGKILSKVDDAGSLISPSRNAMYRTVKGINNGDSAAEIGRLLRSGARGAKIKSAAQHFTIGTQMSLAEASVEARETKKRYIEDEVAKWEEANPGKEMPIEVMDSIVADGNSAGNIAFGINMAVLVPTNLMMFGKAIFGIENKVAASLNPIKNVGKKGAAKWVEDIPDAATAKFLTKSYRLAQPIAKNIISEGVQEGGQFFGSEFARHYTAHDDLAQAVSQGLSQTFGTKEGIESMVIGAIVGGGSGTISRLFGAEKKLAKSKAANTTKAIELLNNDVMSNMIANMEQTADNIRNASLMNKALEAKNTELAEVYRSRIIANEARRYQKIGALDYFYEQLEDVKSLPENEFIARFGYDTTRSVKDQTGKTQSEIIDDVITKTKLSAKRTEQVQEILQSYVPSQTLIGKLFESFGSEETKLSKQMATQIREFAANVVLATLTDVDTLDSNIEKTYSAIQKLAEDNPRLQRIASLISPDMLFKMQIGEITIDETGKKLSLKSTTTAEVADKKLEKEINDINQALLQTNPIDGQNISTLFTVLQNNIKSRERAIGFANLLTSSQSDLENYILEQINAKQAEDKQRANEEAEAITTNAETSQELDENFPANADPAQKAAARARRRQLVEEENRLTNEYTQLSEEDFGAINEEDLPEINKLAYRRALRVREEAKAKTLDARTISLAPEEGKTADFITELTDLEARTFGEVEVSRDNSTFTINGRKYQNFEEDSIDAVILDENDNIIGVKLLDLATGNFVTFKRIDEADPAYNEQSQFENAVVDALSYVIFLQDNAIRADRTQPIEEAKEENKAKAEAVIKDSKKILEFEKTEGPKLNSTPSSIVDGVIDSTQKVSGLSNFELRAQIEVLKADIAEANEILELEWQIAKEAGFSKAEFDKDQMVKDIKKIRASYQKALSYRINILKERKAAAKAAQADLTQRQVAEEIEQTPTPEEAEFITTSVQAEIDKLENELAQVVDKINKATLAISDPNFTPNADFYTGVKDAQQKAAVLREQIAKRKNIIENTNAKESETSGPESGTPEGVTPETEEQEATRTDFAPTEGIEISSTKGISDEEAELIRKKNEAAAKANSTVQKTPAQTGQNLPAQQSQNAEVVVQIQGDLDVQLSPIEFETVGDGKDTKRLVSPTGQAKSGNRVRQTVNGQEIEVNPSLLTDPNLPSDLMVTFEVREDVDFEFTDWTDVPIFVMVTDPTTNQQVRVGILQAGSKSREDIYNLYKQGLTPVANASKLFGSKNIANSRSDQAGTVFFYPASDIINAEQTVALAYVGETRAEGVRIVPVPIPGVNFNMADLNLTGDFTPGQILAVVLNPDGIPVPIPLSTRDMNEQTVNTVVSLIQSEDITDPSKVLEIVGFNSIPPAGLPDDYTGEIEADGIIEMTRDNRDFGMAYVTLSGNIVFVYYSPTANSYVSINQSELSKALNGQKASFSFVVAEQTEKGIDLKTVSKQPAAYQISGEVLADEFKAMLRTKKMQVSKERLANNSSFTSPISGIEYPSYYEYLSSEKEMLESREDGDGSKAVLATDTPSVNDYGSVYYNLGLKFTNISTVEKPVSVEEDLAAKAVDNASANLNTATPVTPAPTASVSDIERIEIPRYFTFGELGGKPGKKAGETIEAERNAEIQENFEKQLKEGDKLIEPNGDVFFYKNGKVVKPNGQPRGLKDIGAFINGVTIERNAELAALEGVKPLVSETAKPVINIYWGSAESSTNTRVLSNLAPRKFTYQGKEYGSVEHAYQTLKSGSFDQATYDKYVKAGGYGTKIRGKAVQKGFDNLQLMRDLVVESFKQNPDQAALLLNYSDFTHTTNEVIDKAFLDGIRLAQKNAQSAALERAKPAVVTAPTIVSQPTSSEAIVGAEFIDELDEFFTKTTMSQNPEVPSMVTPAVENNSSAPTTEATADQLSLLRARFPKQASAENLAMGAAETKAATRKEVDSPNPDTIQDLGEMFTQVCTKKKINNKQYDGFILS